MQPAYTVRLPVVSQTKWGPLYILVHKQAKKIENLASIQPVTLDFLSLTNSTIMYISHWVGKKKSVFIRPMTDQILAILITQCHKHSILQSV